MIKEAQIIEMFSCNDGADYAVYKNGVIKHVNPNHFKYDAQYSATYDTPEYVRQSELLQGLRFAFAQAAHGKRIFSLTDVGYGNGAFMKFAAERVRIVNGIDVTDVPVPDKCNKIIEYENCSVITFHDCLEHFHDLDFVRELPCETLIISLPHCHYFMCGKEWFGGWHHRKPSEHIYHFNEASLTSLLDLYGWKAVAASDHEDIVRKREGPKWNILSMAFKRK